MNLESLLTNLKLKHGLSYYIYNDGQFQELPKAIKLEILFNGRNYTSWGVDDSIDLAFFKGIMELLERVSLINSNSLFYKKNFWTNSLSVSDISKKYRIPSALLVPDNSNGVGMGLNSQKSKLSAKLELIERHTILTAILFGISPKKYDAPEIKVPLDHNVSFFYWKMDKYFTAVAVAALSGGGYLFGYACSTSINKAAVKAWNELVPNIIHTLNNSDENYEINSITKNDIGSFNLYWKFSGDQRVLKFLNSTSSKSFDSIPVIKNFYYSEILIPEEFDSIQFPLRCFRAISPEAQQLFFDNWDNCYLNPNLNFSGPLPNFPHFIA